MWSHTSCQNHTLFHTKKAKSITLFQTKTAPKLNRQDIPIKHNIQQRHSLVQHWQCCALERCELHTQWTCLEWKSRKKSIYSKKVGKIIPFQDIDTLHSTLHKVKINVIKIIYIVGSALVCPFHSTIYKDPAYIGITPAWII